MNVGKELSKKILNSLKKRFWIRANMATFTQDYTWIIHGNTAPSEVPMSQTDQNAVYQKLSPILTSKLPGLS